MRAGDYQQRAIMRFRWVLGKGPPDRPASAGAAYARLMPQRRFPRPWRFEPIPGGYRVIDANGLALAHVYGQPPDAVAFSDTPGLTAVVYSAA
jgi:hypothetical protein